MIIRLPGCYPLLLEASLAHWHRDGTHHGPQSSPRVAAARVVRLHGTWHSRGTPGPDSTGLRLWLYLRGGYAWHCGFLVMRGDARRGRSDLYYECHVTFEPVFGDQLERLREVCAEHQFRVADLLMRKRPRATAQRSRDDTFATGRSRDYEALVMRMAQLVRAAQTAGFKVWRYKIEDTLLDSRHSELDRLETSVVRAPVLRSSRGNLPRSAGHR